MFKNALKILVTSVCLSISLLSYAQNNGKVYGVLTDDKQTPVPFATVTLLHANDSALVKGTYTDEKGVFLIDSVAYADYILSFSHASFKRQISAPFSLNQEQPAKAFNNQLEAGSKQLATVQVDGKKPFIEQKIDRIVVNVQNSITATGSNALELMEILPGVYVDRDGNISLKGKPNVLILINNKPTYMGATDLANMLRNMQSNQVDKIEVMSNPPARYDAAGNGGIINILLKKNENMGLNGSYTLGLREGIFKREKGTSANYLKENGSLNLNYRQGKVNLFGNVSLNNGKTPQSQVIDRKFIEADKSVTNFNQLVEKTADNRSIDYKAGIDIMIDKKNTIGLLVNGMSARSEQDNPTDAKINYANPSLDSFIYTKAYLDNKWINNAVNLNYLHTFNSNGHSLSVDLDYAQFNNSSDQQYRTRKFDSNDQLQQVRNENGDNKSDIYVRTGKADYTLPLKNKAKFEAGVKVSFVTSDNDMAFYFLDNDEHNPVVDPQRTLQFRYKENVNAGYVNYSREFKSTAIQLGLRIENTAGRGKLMEEDLIKRNYTNLFPTVFLQQQLGKDNILAFSYGRRIDRPDYESLNPFLYFFDPYTYNKGNEQLKPQYTDALELSHTYKNGITTTLNYSRTHDAISDFLEQDSERKITYLTEMNIGYMDNYGIGISLPVKITRWWSSNTYLNGYRNHYKGSVTRKVPGYTGQDSSFVQELDVAGTTGTISTVHQFSLPKGFGAELNASYRSSFVTESQLTGKPMGSVSIGAQKKVFNNKGVFKLNFTDMFFTNYFRGQFLFNDINVDVVNKRESRAVRLSFTYQFGNRKVAASRNRDTGVKEEADRIKTN